MANSKRCILRSTSNPGMTWIAGREGDLSIDANGTFRFSFMDDRGQKRELTSGIVNCLGSLEHPASKEISFQTKNSVYVFDKAELEHGLWGVERNQLGAGMPTISYEEYDELRKIAYGLQKGQHQRLSFKEQDAFLKKWEAVNKSIKEGKTTILPPKARQSVGRDR